MSIQKIRDWRPRYGWVRRCFTRRSVSLATLAVTAVALCYTGHLEMAGVAMLLVVVVLGLGSKGKR